VHFGRDADLGDLVEHLRRDRQQADEGGPGASTEHHLQAALQREHLAVEARARDDVGQQVLDVVQRTGLAQRVREREDLLLEEEFLFVIKHGRIVAPDRSCTARNRAPRRTQPCAASSTTPSGPRWRVRPTVARRAEAARQA
jgi:nitroreductase